MGDPTRRRSSEYSLPATGIIPRVPCGSSASASASLLAVAPNRRVTQPQATARTTRAPSHTGPQAPHRTAQATTPLFSFAASRSRGVVWAPLRTVPEKAGPRGAGRRYGSSVGTRGVYTSAAALRGLGTHTAHKLEGSSGRLGIFWE
jgi:hypothetical protein